MITKLHIEGYKSIKNQDIELMPINVLIGGNGIGKTNFISTFNLLRSIFEDELQDYVIKKGGANTLLYMGKKRTSEIVIEMHFEKNGYQNEFNIKLEEAQDNLIMRNSYASLHEQQWKDLPSVFIKGEKVPTWLQILLSQFKVYHFHDAGDKSPMKGWSKLHDNTFLRYDGENIAAFLYFLQEKHPKHFKRIEMNVKAVSPFFDSFNLKPNRLNEETIRLEWKQKGAEDSYFNAYQLSDGTLRFICLATLLLQPEPPQTIIIDEPELGLHPQAINRLATLIKKVSTKSQVIISTQSVNLVDNFDADDIIAVDMKDHASCFRRLNKANLSVWLDEYSTGELWEKNLIGGQL